MSIFLNISIAATVYLSPGQIDDSTNKAWTLIESQLKIIELFVYKESFDSSAKYIDALYFFEDLTNIQSESPLNYAGKWWPTINDYKKWRRWFKKNKSNIYWDNMKKIIVLHR